MNRASTAAAAVTDKLNSDTWSVEFTAVRTYQVNHQRAELESIKVSVVPKAATRKIEGRSAVEHVVQVDIGVQQAVDPESLADCDAMLDLLMEIADAFHQQTLDCGGVRALCTEVEHEPLFLGEHLDQQRVFTGVVTLSLTMYG